MTAAGPLAGRRVLVLRATAQAAALSERIRALGGEPVEAPVLEIEPGDTDALRAAMARAPGGEYSLLGLTSPNGVDALADALADEHLDARALAGFALVACVGPGTAARLFERLRVVADLVPPRATTSSLADAVPPGSGRALLPRADLANPVLAEVLSGKGYEPVAITAYRTGRPERLDEGVVAALQAGTIDVVAFASSSTVRNFAALAPPGELAARVVSIGPVTSRTCAQLGFTVAVEARPHDLDGLVAAVTAAVS